MSICVNRATRSSNVQTQTGNTFVVLCPDHAHLIESEPGFVSTTPYEFSMLCGYPQWEQIRR